MFPYRTMVEWSNEDECYVASAPAFEALRAHGETQAEAVAELTVAGEAMIASMKKHKRSVPAPDADVADYAGKIALRVPRSLHARVALLAQAEAVSVNQLLVSFISEGVGRRSKAG